jgi:pimeloyl-ACP methyl ester carboxylesterase
MNQPKAGYFPGGLPYSRSGHGPRPLVIFQGLMSANKPPSRLATMMYSFLEDDFTVYSTLGKPGMPRGYTLGDMGDDYAAMIRDEFGGPVDVLGTSTGGSIVQHFAADHPDLVRRLVIHSAAHTLNERARVAQMAAGRLAAQGKWAEAWAEVIRLMNPPTASGRVMVAFVSRMLALSAPDDPSDFIITIEAEDRHAFRDRLGEITAPTLVVAGADDPFYAEALFRETAAGIPGAQLCLYPGMGHPARGKRFQRDVLAFLREEGPV